MKKYLYKIIFPFYKSEKHKFLLGNMWFRALIALSILVVFISIASLWMYRVNDFHEDCVQGLKKAYSLNEYEDGENKINKEMEIYTLCSDKTREAWTYPGIMGDSIIQPIIIFYLLQFLFFSIVINFIYLGSEGFKNTKK